MDTTQEFNKRSKNYEMDNVPKFQVGDIVRRMVARSQKLDAAWSKRLYRITRVKQYKTNRGAGFELEPLAEAWPVQSTTAAARVNAG